MVIGTTGNPHAIRMFPKESCTCPSTGRCYHIIAVRMSIGLEDVNSQRKVNLTQLRRNTRSRTEKRSGRKAPRPGDYYIEPAPHDASILVRSFQGVAYDLGIIIIDVKGTCLTWKQQSV